MTMRTAIIIRASPELAKDLAVCSRYARAKSTVLVSIHERAREYYNRSWVLVGSERNRSDVGEFMN